MSLSHIGTSASVANAGGVATNPITVTPSWPTSYTATAGDLAVVTAVSKHDTEATPTIDWTADGTDSASGGGGAFGAGTGPVRITWWWLELAGGESTPTVSLAGTNTGRNLNACITIIRRTAQEAYGVVAAFGAETTAGTGWSQATTADPGIANGDLLIVGYAVRDDQPSSFTAMGITATGATIGSVTERADFANAGGNDSMIGVGTADVTAGTSSAAPVLTATIGSSETGEVGVLRIREVTPKTDPPTLVAYTETAWSGTGTPKSVGASISWETGDEIYALGVTADSGATLGTPTVSGLTFNQVGSNPVGGGGTQMYSWKAVAASASSGTIQFSRASGSFEFGGAVWQFRGSDGTGNRATSTGSAITVSLARGDDHSHVIELLTDFDAGSTAGYGWTPSGQTEREAAQQSGAYTNYAADWPDVTSAGTTSYGVTGVSGTYTIIAIEVQGTVGGGTDAPAELASGTGSANNPSAAIQASTTTGTGTGAADNPAASVKASTTTGTGTGSADNPSASVKASAGLASGTGTANNATVSTGAAETNAQAELATGTGTADNPAAKVSATAGLASGTGTGNDTTSTVKPTPTTAAGTGTANDPSRSVSTNAGTASGTGTGNNATVKVAPTPATATGTGTAENATVQTGSFTNAQAGLASGTGAANNPSVKVSPVVGTAVGTGTANNAVAGAAVSANAGLASGTGTANNATPNLGRSAMAGLASGTGTVDAASLAVRAAAEAAAALGVAWDADIPPESSRGSVTARYRATSSTNGRSRTVAGVTARHRETSTVGGG